MTFITDTWTFMLRDFVKFILVVGIWLTNNWRGRGKYCSVTWLCNFCCCLLRGKYCSVGIYLVVVFCITGPCSLAFISGLYWFFISRLSETGHVNNVCCFFILFYFIFYLIKFLSLSQKRKEKKKEADTFDFIVIDFFFFLKDKSIG